MKRLLVSPDLKQFVQISLIFLLLFLAGVPALGANAVSLGKIAGTITCEGNPVAGVVVAVAGPLPVTDNIWVGTTQANGQYATDFQLPPGSYHVRHYYLEGVCQFPDVLRTVTVTAGQVTTVDFSGAICSDLVQNGSFEQIAAWQVGLTPSPAAYDSSQARTGIRSMRSGILPGAQDRVSESSFYQTLTLPANATSLTLSFWYRPYTQENVGALESWQDVSWQGYSPDRSLAGESLEERIALQDAGETGWYWYDWQEVLVLDTGYRLLEVLQRDLSNAGVHGWVPKTYDLTPYKGRSIVLYFNTINNGIGDKRTWMFVDDVQLFSCFQPPACNLTPSDRWVNLYGLESTFLGAPLAPGQIVEAYTPQGVLAGCYLVRSEGRYGSMPVYGDNPSTPVIEGLQPGEAITLKVNGQTAMTLGPDTAKWTTHGQTWHVELAVGGHITRHVPLYAGWNLISFDVMPVNTAPENLLAPIAGKYDRVLGFTCAEGGLAYYPNLPPALNTLRVMDPYHGYWIYMTQPATLPVTGPEMPDGIPLRLCHHWNLIAYLPDGPLPVEQALDSIAGTYSVVLGYNRGALSYYPNLPPALNSLRMLAPSFGYWIRPTQDAVLTYPSAGPGLALAASEAAVDIAAPANGVLTTHRWADAFSLSSTLNGRPLPAGTVIEVFLSSGLKVGHLVVAESGQYGPLPIYGDDATTDEVDGARPGDALIFTVNGVKARTYPPNPVWEGEYVLMEIDLAIDLQPSAPAIKKR